MKKTTHIYMPENHMEELYNSKNTLVRFVHRKRLDIIANELTDIKNIKILDAGCGEGHLIERMFKENKNNSYYGIDVTDIALDVAKKRCPFASLKRANLCNTKFKDNYFDIIICTEVLEHIFEYKEVLSELMRILKSGGYLIITFPNETLWTLSRLLLGRKPIRVPDHVNSFTPNVMKRNICMSLSKTINMPFGLPFALSLNCLMKFKKL